MTQHKEATKHKQNLSKHRQPHKIKITLSGFGSLLYNTQDCLNDTCLAKLLESLCCATDNESQQGIRSKTDKTMVVTFLIKEDILFVCVSFHLVWLLTFDDTQQSTELMYNSVVDYFSCL